MAKAELPVYIRIGNREEVIGTVTISGGDTVVLSPRHWQAEALRQAADDLYGDNGPGNPLSTATWLRDRADQLEKERRAVDGEPHDA